MRDRRAVFALFFFSGTAGLVYQVLWLRRLSLVFGVSVYAASTVLAKITAFDSDQPMFSPASGAVSSR